jgi:inward rectifier potassium channel
MATIGYGTISPQTPYAHAIVTVEAAFGILGVALVTGLMFAKASRPRASVLFSRPALIATYNRKPALMFRVGNAKGNEIIEATIHVSALIDVDSPEGLKFRRLHDLTLVRDMTPLFALSWTVIHVIDESSPLHGLDPESIDKRLVSIVCTMTGHDGTYSSTVHARHLYYPEDVRFGHRFVDVISFLPDGRPMVDYDVFHQTEPEPPPPPPPAAA